METLRKEGLPVNDLLEQKASELEEEIIKKEILPMLTVGSDNFFNFNQFPHLRNLSQINRCKR